MSWTNETKSSTATLTNEAKNTSTFTNLSKTVLEFLFLIDDTYEFLIDDTYKLATESGGINWTNQIKS